MRSPTRPLPGPRRGRLVRFLGAAALALAAWPAFPSSAAAEFRVCNTTDSRIGVALGYRAEGTWVTEGWWNFDAATCETIIRGPLDARYYYIYAIDYDHGGEWRGEAFMCTEDQMFLIEGIEDCEQRGHVRTGFFEIDTREQTSWTVQFTDPSTNGTGGQ